MGVNGGYAILMAFNTLYQVGTRSHVIEFVFGARSCDGDTAIPQGCPINLALGGWGTTRVGEAGEPIPDHSIYFMNNLIYNPAGVQSQWQQFAIFGPQTPSPDSNIPSPAVTDDNLRIQGNVLWNGPADHSLGIGEGSGCQPPNPTCNAEQLVADNYINTLEPRLVDPEHGDFHPWAGSALFTYSATPIPPFPDWSMFTPAVPAGNPERSVTRDRANHLRPPGGVVGAYANSNSAPLRYTLAATTAGAGLISSAPSGILCGADCSESYAAGTQVILTATPDPGYLFNGWSGACAGQASVCVVTLNADQTVTANFALISRLINLSTRAQVGTGDNVMIGGFVIGGTAPRKVLIRAIGPSMAPGVAGTLANPRITLTTVTGTPVASNDNWQDGPDAAEIQTLGLQPTHANEAALLLTLNPNTPYTPIVEGVGGATGVTLVEIYDVDETNNASRLINISTRGRVGTGDNVMIGGFVIGGAAPRRVLIRAIGPSMAPGVAGTLGNPRITLTTVSGTPVASNDNWQDGPDAAEIQTLGLQPTNANEAALLLTLEPNTPYTPIVEGVGGATGVALVEIYEAP